MLISKLKIDATPERVWEVLKDKIFHPDRFIPQLEDFEIEERSEGEYIRTIITEMDDVVELIKVDEATKTIEYVLVRHFVLKGNLWNRVIVENEITFLVFEQDRSIKLEEMKGMDMQPALDAAVQQIKELAEA